MVLVGGFYSSSNCLSMFVVVVNQDFVSDEVGIVNKLSIHNVRLNHNDFWRRGSLRWLTNLENDRFSRVIFGCNF